MRDSIRITQDTLCQYRDRFDNWQVSWTGEEPSAADLHEQHYQDGSVQKLLFGN